MVRCIKYTLAFFRLVRVQNLAIIVITMYLLRWLVLFPILNNNTFKSQITEFEFFLLVLSTVLIAAAGYIINDYFDRKADLINRPGKVILGRLLKRRTGMFWHFVLSILGVLLGTYFAYRVGLFRYSMVFFLISGLLWFYSTTYKRQVVLGNVVVAFLSACVPLIVLLFELPLILKKYQINIIANPTDLDILSAWIIGYAAFAFLLNLIREIIKDIEDLNGDKAFGRQTIPIRWGVRVAKVSVIFVSVLVLILLLLALYKFRFSLYTIVYVSLFLILPVLFLLFKVPKAKTQKQYYILSLLLKLIMLSGIFYLVLASLWIF